MAEVQSGPSPAARALARRPARLKSENLSFAYLFAFVSLFAATRVVVHLSGLPYLDPESYLHLAGADSLRSEGGLPSFYSNPAAGASTTLPSPGYAWFIYLVWLATRSVTLDGVAMVQSLVTFAGFLAVAYLFCLWLGRTAAVAVFVALCLSPSVAWLEHSLVPEALAAPVLLLAMFAAASGSPAADTSSMRRKGGLIAGALASIAVLLRTTSQMYSPLPWLLAMGRRTSLKNAVTWTLLYAVAVGGTLSPWLLHNDDAHGVLALGVGPGRGLYANAAWAGTMDRTTELRRHGLGQNSARSAAVPLAARALRSEMAKGRSLVEADKALGERALAAYRSQPPRLIAEQRLATVKELFVAPDDAGSAALAPLVEQRSRYLANPYAGKQARATAASRIGHRFSADFTSAASKPRPTDPLARQALDTWIKLLTIDGWNLLAAFLFATLILVWKSPLRLPLFLTVVAPPLVFFAYVAFFGVPSYRDQASLHPFMIATVVAAAATLLGPSKRSVGGGSALRRGMAI